MDMGIMENKIVFLIPSYERIESLTEIVKVIHEIGDVYIIQDGGRQDYSSLLKYGVHLYRNKNHLGKKLFNVTVNILFNIADNHYADYYFFIPDDLIPVKDFHLKAIDTYNNINDNKKICLNLFLEQSRLGQKCWTDFSPIDKCNVYLSNWVDMCFLCKQEMFVYLNFYVPKIDRDWKKYPELGSGVGSYISKRLFLMGRNMYQVKSSLFIPHEAAFKSKMNPGQNNELINKVVI
jgi:hypothetical protein